MRRLSALDASFIYLESDHSPMHIGGVYLMDAAEAPEGFGYAAFRAHIERRLQCSRVFRERLVEATLSLSYPCWINDPEFRLDRHLPHLELLAPGGRRELMRLAARLFSEPLDRKHPLWEMAFVEGLDSVEGLTPGSFAMISRVHHAAVDGGSGVELMAALLDVTPEPREVPGPDDWEPERLPGTARMVGSAWTALGRKSVELGKVAGEVARGAARVYGAHRAGRVDPPPLPFTAPPTRLNRSVTSSRTYWGVEFDFDRIRRIRARVPGVTVNDVVLSVCAGGLRAYLLERGELPDDPLVAMAPVSMRQAQDRGAAGNQVSAMLVGLATDVTGPLERLLRIQRQTMASKLYSGALPAHRIAEFIPSETLAAAARLYTRMRLGGRHRPFFNLIVTNVPGPSVPLYLAGARLRSQFGMAPILDGLGLIVVVLSYAGRLSVSVTSCFRVVPDPDHLCALTEQALGELEAAVAEAGPQRVAELARRTSAEDTGSGAGDSPADRLRRASRELDEAIAIMDRKLKENT